MERLYATAPAAGLTWVSDENSGPSWGYWLGAEWVELPKLPLQRAGYEQPPFEVARPDGRVLSVVERVLDADRDGRRARMAAWRSSMDRLPAEQVAAIIENAPDIEICGGQPDRGVAP